MPLTTRKRLRTRRCASIARNANDSHVNVANQRMEDMKTEIPATVSCTVCLILGLRSAEAEADKCVSVRTTTRTVHGAKFLLGLARGGQTNWFRFLKPRQWGTQPAPGEAHRRARSGQKWANGGCAANWAHNPARRNKVPGPQLAPRAPALNVASAGGSGSGGITRCPLPDSPAGPLLLC
jgi:hypothetical protein